MTCTMLTGEGECTVETLIEGKEEEKHALLATNSTANTTAGLAVHPDSDEAGPDTDILYVLRDPEKGPTAVQQFGTAHEPGQVAAPTEADDEHGAEAGFSSVNGLGFDDSSGRLFVSSTSYGFAQGIGNGSRVFLLDEIPAPVASLDPITTFDTEKADLHRHRQPRRRRNRVSLRIRRRRRVPRQRLRKRDPGTRHRKERRPRHQPGRRRSGHPARPGRGRPTTSASSPTGSSPRSKTKTKRPSRRRPPRPPSRARRRRR